MSEDIRSAADMTSLEPADEMIGRPNWDQRERMSSDEDQDVGGASASPESSGAEADAQSNVAFGGLQDWMVDPTKPAVTTNEAASLDHTSASSAHEERPEFIVDGFDDVPTLEVDLNELPQARPDEVSAEESDVPEDASGIEEDAAIVRVESETLTDDHSPVDDVWKHRAEALVSRWGDLSERFDGQESFKTGLLLPLLSTLGYDVFDPEQVEPIEDDSGKHDGYLAKGPRGKVVVLLEGADVPDDFADDVIIESRRDRLKIGLWSPREDEQSTGRSWQTAFVVDLKGSSSVAGLRPLLRDAFDREAVAELAHQTQGQQEHIAEALRQAILDPGAGLVGDIRIRLAGMGHENTAMLAERIAQAGARLLSGGEEDDEADSGKEPRSLTGEERRGLAIIQEICANEIPASRIVPRPGKSYCAVLLDDNNRKTIARLHFTSASAKYVGTFIGRDETKEKIDVPEEIRSHADAIRRRARELDPGSFGE